MTDMETNQAYPAKLQIDYPEATNRLTSFFRPFVVIPILIILMLLSGNSTSCGMATAGGVLTLPVLLLLLFRQKYPKWWFDWNLALTRFAMRVSAYILLLQHDYPSTDEEQLVHVELKYPEAHTELNRWLPLVKWFLAIPHYIVLFFLGIAAFVVTIIAWFAILFTGKYPSSLYDFVVGYLRWNLRVEAYAFLLITDKYPPFSLQP